MKKINLNSCVKVRLTERGKEIFRHQYDEVNAYLSGKRLELLSMPEPHVDSEGYTELLLWQLIQLYGPHIGIGFPEVFDGIYIYMEEGDLTDAKID